MVQPQEGCQANIFPTQEMPGTCPKFGGASRPPVTRTVAGRQGPEPMSGGHQDIHDSSTDSCSNLFFSSQLISLLTDIVVCRGQTALSQWWAVWVHQPVLPMSGSPREGRAQQGPGRDLWVHQADACTAVEACEPEGREYATLQQLP